MEYQRLRAERGVHHEDEDEEEAEIEPDAEAGSGEEAARETESSEQARQGVGQAAAEPLRSPSVDERSSGSGERGEEPWGVILEWLSQRRFEQAAQLPDDVAAAVQRLVGSEGEGV